MQATVIFSDFLNIYMGIYLNDILIYLDNISQHKNYIKEVLHQLQKARLYIKIEKYMSSTLTL